MSKPPAFYCWTCERCFSAWPDSAGYVGCQCGSSDVQQIERLLAIADAFTPPDPFSRKV